MHIHEHSTRDPDHVFLGAYQKTHERRTQIVIGLTAIMMVLEIAAGLLFGSMALLADGWHMASLAAILCLTTGNPRKPIYYKDLLRRFEELCHVTVEVNSADSKGE